MLIEEENNVNESVGEIMKKEFKVKKIKVNKDGKCKGEFKIWNYKDGYGMKSEENKNVGN
jgi:hypothetical protein